MQDNIAKIFIGILTMIVILGGFLLYQQQQSITDLRRRIPQASNAVGEEGSSAPLQSVGANFNQAEETRKQLREKTKDIFGEVREISLGSLTVEAQIVDFSKLDAVDYSQPTALPTISKKFRVKVTSNTVYAYGEFSGLKVGSEVQILSKEPIYDTSEITATKIFVGSPNFE